MELHHVSYSAIPPLPRKEPQTTPLPKNPQCQASETSLPAVYHGIPKRLPKQYKLLPLSNLSEAEGKTLTHILEA